MCFSIVCMKVSSIVVIGTFFYISMNYQGKRIVVLDLTAFPFLQALEKENTVDCM